MGYQYKMRIGAAWCEAACGDSKFVMNPATEEEIRSLPYGDGVDCKLAIEAAAKAFRGWAQMTAYQRAEILKRTAQLIRERLEDLGHTTSHESGKPLLQSKGEWGAGADLFEWYAEECKRSYGRVIPAKMPNRKLTVIKQPVGVVGIITAWNFPIYNIARSAAAALGAGCTIVIRPSEFTPQTAIELVNILVEAGMPDGVVNLVLGRSSSIGEEMLANPKCAKIHFTGSPRVGRLLMEGSAKTIKKLSLELGGNAPVLVFADADVDKVATSAVVAKFRNAGQVCVAPQRFIVHESIAQQFAEVVTAATKSLKQGYAFDAGTQIGPLISRRQFDSIESLVNRSVEAGATLLTGGKRATGFAKGYFYEPTVLSDVSVDSPAFREEIFGPVLPITTFSTIDDAIKLANDTPHGLASYAWSNDVRIVRRCAEELEFGMVAINDWTPHATEGPFVGWKESGVGKESGAEGLEEYLETKLVSEVVNW